MRHTVQVRLQGSAQWAPAVFKASGASSCIRPSRINISAQRLCIRAVNLRAAPLPRWMLCRPLPLA